MRTSAIALACAVMTATSALVAAPAQAASPNAVQAAHNAARTADAPPVAAPVPARQRMGRYDVSRFEDRARRLPASLDAQLRAQLGMSAAQFLADGQAAADAAQVVAGLRERGVRVTDARMHGTALTVSVADAADEPAVRAAGATPTVAPDRAVRTAAARPLSSPADGSSPLEGGDLWFYRTDDVGHGVMCSTGFTGFDAKTGAHEIVTAGHCADYAATGDPAPLDGKVYAAADGTPVSYDGGDFGLGQIGALNQSSFTFGGGRDAGLVNVTSTAARPAAAVGTWGSTDASASTASSSSEGAQSSGANIPVYGQAAAVAGAPVCHSGARTGWQCGTVTDAYVQVRVGANSSYQLVDGVETDVCVLEGDSGGAFISGNYAVGVASAGDATPRGSSGSAYHLCASASDSFAYPMVASVSGEESVSAQLPSFQLAVVEPSTTPIVTAGSDGNPAVLSGTLVFGDGTPAPAGIRVSLSIDGGAPVATSSAANSSGAQAWRFSLTSVPAGSHRYTVTVGTGYSAVSVGGTFTVSPTPAHPSSTRVSGADRYATAVAASQKRFPNGAPVVLLASGADYPDALAAAPAAAKAGGDLLLTAPGSLPASVTAELKRLAPHTVYVIGGTGAVSGAVATQVRSAIGVTPVRVAGADRYATSAAIAAKFFPSAGAVFTATGLGFPDALSGAGAAAGALDPVLLVPGTGAAPTAAVSSQLTRLHPATVYIVGGTAVVSAKMATALGKAGRTVRLAGADRYATSVAVGSEFFSSATSSVVASGAGFPDALVGSVLAGGSHAPLFLSQPGCMPPAVVSELRGLGVVQLVLMGGTASLSGAVAVEKPC